MERLRKPKYSIFKTLSDERVLVRRIVDGETLLGHPFAIDTDDDLLELFTRDAGAGAVNVLNHENLVSIHNEVINFPVRGPMAPDLAQTDVAERYLLWDWCDAGTVASLIADTPAVRSATGFLPESLVWHVALGILRALQWLHEGVRDTYAVVARDGASTSTRFKRVRGKIGPRPGQDWMPILHRQGFAGNMFLQQPRGIETYGAVKLGDFSFCMVSGHAEGALGKAPLVGVRSTWEPKLAELKNWRSTWREALKDGGVRYAQSVVPPVRLPSSLHPLRLLTR